MKYCLGVEFGSTRIKAVAIDEKHIVPLRLFHASVSRN